MFTKHCEEVPSIKEIYKKNTNLIWEFRGVK